ncbi:DUF1559 domain-containing protein [Opitutaceae bacterium TAV4]|nr:DUF1559 domain-containing protein [Opitutaceae bacterium TAV4]RRK01926.1 DUF1559 domain-containing protein [Opitutaceae bacterium TAV3]
MTCFPITSPDPARRAHAFTLIELLTVIAIIGILAGILIPVTLLVRDQARVTQCQSNLRQIHFALMMYVDDNKGYLPAGPNAEAGLTPLVPPTYSKTALNSLTLYLTPYMSLSAIGSATRLNPYMRCPAGSPLPSKPGDAEKNRSYGLAGNASSGVGFPFGNYTDINQGKPKRLLDYTEGRNPRTRWAVRDIDVALHNTPDQVVANQSHKKGRNYLYFDGHVRLLNAAQEVEQVDKIKNNNGW